MNGSLSAQVVTQRIAMSVRMILMIAQLTITSGLPLARTYVKTGPKTLTLATSAEKTARSAPITRSASQGAVLTQESMMLPSAENFAMMSSRSLSSMRHQTTPSTSPENAGQLYGLGSFSSYSSGR